MSIHTGPVIGLVAGTKVPDYCIMSDTVDTTRDLMIQGEGMKILITETSKEVLDRAGRYRCDYRGRVDMGVSWEDRQDKIEEVHDVYFRPGGKWRPTG